MEKEYTQAVIGPLSQHAKDILYYTCYCQSWLQSSEGFTITLNVTREHLVFGYYT